jgi:hypothetical protein
MYLYLLQTYGKYYDIISPVSFFSKMACGKSYAFLPEEMGENENSDKMSGYFPADS